MEIDITRALGSVQRALSTRTHEGQDVRVLTVTRHYSAPRAEIWDALTTPERLERWFLPISGDLRPGGHYALTGNASGKILRCDPPSELSITWEFGSVSWVEISLTESDRGTDLRLEHLAFVDQAMWDEYGPGGAGIGWEMALLGLDLFAAGDTLPDLEARMSWIGSGNGRAIVRAYSDAWVRASIEFGTNPDHAAEAGAKTTAFYTPPAE